MQLAPDGTRTAEDPLAAFLMQRSVQRRSMRTTPLTLEARAALRQSVHGYDLVLLGQRRERIAMAALNARNAGIRLTIPEAYEVHKEVIAWDCRTSDDRIPDADPQ